MSIPASLLLCRSLAHKLKAILPFLVYVFIFFLVISVQRSLAALCPCLAHLVIIVYVCIHHIFVQPSLTALCHNLAHIQLIHLSEIKEKNIFDGCIIRNAYGPALAHCPVP